MKNYRWRFGALFIMLAFSACKKSSNNQIKKNIDADVYVAGLDNGDAVYWKNGAETKLTNKCLQCYAQGIAVGTGGDIYVAGVKTYNGLDYMAVYWTNGTPSYLTDSTKGIESFANALSLSGSDVYVGGYIVSSGATWWKNGIAYPVNTQSAASGICVSGSDVYLGGETFLSAGTNAAYWKNGNIVTLTNADNTGHNGGSISSVFVSGNDVYVAGITRDAPTGNRNATYWKNGAATTLNTSSKDAIASSIYVDNGDVYVCGSENENGVYVAEYWKNNNMVKLSTSKSNATGIFVLNGHVYVSGNTIDGTGAAFATVWVDGSAIKIGAGNSQANGLFVK